MKYAVDKIIDEIVTLENIETKEIENIPLELLPEGIKESTILKKIYIIDEQEEIERKENIQSLFDKLKN